jgi:hypothetical protein
MFLDSGKFINDLGKYLDCKNLSYTNYFLAEFTIGKTGKVAIDQFNSSFNWFIYGLCLPKNCNITLLSQKVNGSDQLLNAGWFFLG